MIYLDTNATTPHSPQVIDAITDCLRNDWANASSSYGEGIEAKRLISASKNRIIHMINAIDGDNEITFTSGGTEANNWVILSTVNNKIINNDNSKAHIITTNIEHDSINQPLHHLLSVYPKSRIDVSFVSVCQLNGCVSVDDIIAQIRPETCLITVMMANNETGAIQPIAQIGERLRQINGDRTANKLPQILYHCDAAQAFGKINVDVQQLNLDFLTIVGHKFYGPRIGALYHRIGSPLTPLMYGGGQESGRRPGTENTAMIVGLGVASELVTKHLDDYSEHFLALQVYLESQLKQHFEDMVVINCENSSKFGRLPNTTSVAFIGDALIGSRILSLTPNLRASVGAACHSSHAKDAQPSKVLMCSGVSEYLAKRTIRLSTGRDTCIEDIDNAIKELKHAINLLLNNDTIS